MKIIFVLLSIGIVTTSYPNFRSPCNYKELDSNSPQKIDRLANLCKIWGFLKYHHPTITQSDTTFSWDSELLRIIPKALKAPSTAEFDNILIQWIDDLGPVKPCKSCNISNNNNIQHAPSYGGLFGASNNLSRKVQRKLSSIKENFEPVTKQRYIAFDSIVGNPVFDNDKSFNEDVFPPLEIRLLALFRYWNIIQYYYPYRHLIKDWEGMLVRLIPDMIEAKNKQEYTLSFLKLITHVKDSHANIWGENRTLDTLKGINFLPVEAKFLNDTLVVVKDQENVQSDSNTLKFGDIIENINGVPVLDLVQKFLPYSPGSNYEGQLNEMVSQYGFLLRTNNNYFDITINRDGFQKLIRCTTIPAHSYEKNDKHFLHKQGYLLVNDSLGYIYAAKLSEDDLPKMIQEFKHTKGLIIDLRCYASVFMPYNYGAWIKPLRSSFVKLTVCSPHSPGTILYDSVLYNGEKNDYNYQGKVVVVVNIETLSRSEFITMALSSSPNVTVVGSTTAGANGDLSLLSLPGGIQTGISGIGIYYPDMTSTQQVGVMIDNKIKPSVKVLQERRDELLEHALQIVTSQ